LQHDCLGKQEQLPGLVKSKLVIKHEGDWAVIMACCSTLSYQPLQLFGGSDVWFLVLGD